MLVRFRCIPQHVNSENRSNDIARNKAKKVEWKTVGYPGSLGMSYIYTALLVTHQYFVLWRQIFKLSHISKFAKYTETLSLRFCSYFMIYSL